MESVITRPVQPEDERVNDLTAEDADSQATPQSVGDTTNADSERERIAERAYELYMSRGGADGRALDDWLAAERELATGRRRDDES